MCRDYSTSRCDDLFSSLGKRMCLAYELQWRFVLIKDVNNVSASIRVFQDLDNTGRAANKREDKRWWNALHHVEAAHLHAGSVSRWREKKGVRLRFRVAQSGRTKYESLHTDLLRRTTVGIDVQGDVEWLQSFIQKYYVKIGTAYIFFHTGMWSWLDCCRGSTAMKDAWPLWMRVQTWQLTFKWPN